MYNKALSSILKNIIKCSYKNKIYHIEVTSSFNSVADFPFGLKASVLISNVLNFSDDKSLALIEKGAVYLRNENSVTPKAKRLLVDELIKTGDYLRIHSQSTSYDLSHIKWTDRIIYQSDDFLVINKPHNIPCVPTVGNQHDNVISCLEKVFSQQLYPPHRLDIDTEGLLIICRTKKYTKYIGDLFKNHKIYKRYRMIVVQKSKDRIYPFAVSQVPCHLTHYMNISKFVPKVLYDYEHENTIKCESRVISMSPVRSKSREEWTRWLEDEVTLHPQYLREGTSTMSRLQEAFQISWFSEDENKDLDKYIYSLCELEIELITGRAHQLRSQIQFLSSETTRPKHSDAFTPTRLLTPDASHSQKGPQKEELYSVQIAGDEIYSTNYMRNVKKLNDRDDSQLQDQHDNTNSTGYSLYQNEGDRGICGDAVKADTSKLYANNRYVSSPHLALQCCHLSIDDTANESLHAKAFTLPQEDLSSSRAGCWWFALSRYLHSDSPTGR